MSRERAAHSYLLHSTRYFVPSRGPLPHLRRTERVSRDCVAMRRAWCAYRRDTRHSVAKPRCRATLEEIRSRRISAPKKKSSGTDRLDRRRNRPTTSVTPQPGARRWLMPWKETGPVEERLK